MAALRSWLLNSGVRAVRRVLLFLGGTALLSKRNRPISMGRRLVRSSRFLSRRITVFFNFLSAA